MPILKVLYLVQAGIFGLVVGSFLNVCIYRIPQQLSLLGRSFCPWCKAPIPMYRNIPLISFLMQGGKSACCAKKISFNYPVVELITGILSVLTLYHCHALIDYFLWFLLFMCPLMVLSVIDLKLKIIPDIISLPFICVGIVVQQYLHYPHWLMGLKFSAWGILLGGGALLLLAEIMTRLLKKEAMGGGDIKLMGMLGAFLGPQSLIFIYMAGSFSALIYAIICKIVSKSKDQQIPFGPFLSLGAIIFWFFRHSIIEQYLGPVFKFYAGLLFR